MNTDKNSAVSDQNATTMEGEVAEIDRLQSENAMFSAVLIKLQKWLAEEAGREKMNADYLRRVMTEAAKDADKALRIANGDYGLLKYFNLPAPLNWAEPVPDPSQPVPLVFRRARDGEEPDLWAADRYLSHTEEYARRMIEMETPEYKAYHDASALLRLTPVTSFDHLCDGEEFYADSVEEYLEHFEDREPPSFAYITRTETFDFNLWEAIDSHMTDNHHEDAYEQLVDCDALSTAYDEWVKKQTVKTWWPEHTKIFVLNQDKFDAECAAARAVVDAWNARENAS